MNPRFLCAMVLALALPALAQTEPPLEPLVPPNAPWLQKNQKKKRTKKKAAPKRAPAAQAGKAPEPGLTLPPLEPLTLPPAIGSVGVLVLGPLPGGAAARVQSGLQAVAMRGPGVKDAFALQAPDPCTDEACWITAGVARGAGRVLVASYGGGALRLRLLDVKSRKQVSEAQQGAIAVDALQVTAWAEALGCKLLVPAGCTAEVVLDADKGVALEIDGQPVRPAEKRRTLAVGVHALRVRDAGSESTRPLPVLIEGNAPLLIAAARPAPPAPAIAPAAPAVPAAAPAEALLASPAPAPRRAWTRTAGYAAGGAAVIAAAAGVYFGAASKSDLDSAESSYRANGNAWTPGGLDTLHSGNSKAHTANALFIASGVLLAAGAALTFAF